MIKVLTTPSGREVTLSSTAAFLYIYKNQFRREPLKDLMEIASALTENENEEENYMEMIQKFDMETIYGITWALAKCADKNTPEPLEFYTKNPDFFPIDHIDVIVDMALGSMLSTVEIEKN